MIFFPKFTKYISSFSTVSLMNSKTVKFNKSDPFYFIKAFYSKLFVFLVKFLFIYTLRAYYNNNWSKSFSFSSLNQGWLKNYSNEHLLLESLTSIFWIKSFAASEISKGNLTYCLWRFLNSLRPSFGLFYWCWLIKGFFPKSISYMMIPKLQMSHFSLYSFLSKISGAIVKGVPTQELRYWF